MEGLQVKLATPSYFGLSGSSGFGRGRAGPSVSGWMHTADRHSEKVLVRQDKWQWQRMKAMFQRKVQGNDLRYHEVRGELQLRESQRMTRMRTRTLTKATLLEHCDIT